MATFHLTTLLRRTAHRTGVLVAALALAGAPGRAAAQQDACYVPSVGAVYLIGLTGLPTACLAPSHVPVTLGGGALADGSVTTVKLADGAVNGAKLAAFLEMANGFSLTGPAGLGTIPAEGPGVRMMWYPRKLAFRSGWVTGTQWDDANVGWVSTALGKNTTASGDFSTALGMNASTNGLEGTFVYGDASQDNTSFLVMPTAANQFVVRASGGVRFFTSPDLSVGCDIAALGFGDLRCTGMIHSAFGGFKFPDGTLQTTAATAGGSGDITEVLSGSGLTGGGSTGSVTLSADLTSGGGDNGIGTTVARGDHVHDSRYFTEPELNAAGVINAASNPVDWTKLKGVPAAFADGVDDGGTFTASTPIAIAGTDIQLSTAGCVAGELWKWSGTAWQCVPDNDSGGDITSVAAGTGLAGGGDFGSLALAVLFAGTGGATSAARSDHTHGAADLNTAVGDQALEANTTGQQNTAVGDDALQANTTGNFNTALGFRTLGLNTTGASNTAVGADALFLNTASYNVGVGHGALTENSTGQRNVAAGAEALRFNHTGNFNVAVGTVALHQSTGSANIAIGDAAGVSLTSGDNNIYIWNSGVSSESNTIRIGRSDVHSSVFLAGISGQTSASGVGVLVNSEGKLGTMTSSARAKEAVEDLGTASRRLLRLRPVQFRYKPEYDDGSRLVQYGLIAEEVAEVFPELVAYRPSGEVETVRYHLFPALLLNELQRQEQELVALRWAVEELRAELRRRQR